MNKQKDNNAPQTDVKVRKDDRSSLIIGILTMIVIVGIFFALLAALGNASRLGGTMTLVGKQQLRRGNDCTFVYETDAKIDDGTKVVWYVNGEEAGNCDYAQGKQLSFDYTPETCGQLNLQAKIGDKYSKNSVYWVEPPQLTLTAPTITITYGEKPDIEYACDGLVCDDCVEDICYDCCYTLTNADGESRSYCNDDVLQVGTYTIDLNKECRYKDYETSYVSGTLTVLTKKLSVIVADKVYDRTTNISSDKITPEGICANDDVLLQFDKAQFIDRNAGNKKKVNLQNLRLAGNDSGNYVVDEQEIYGRVLPKTVSLNGTTVFEKRYDGTTKATIDKLGKLVGISDGDSVAIGSVVAKFDTADIGNDKKVTLQDIVLVGADKDNYVIGSVEEIRASITR